MLEKTYVHLPGIGPKTERALWECGLADWHAALGHAGRVPGVSAGRWDECRRCLEESVRSLAALDHAFFAPRLPAGEHWRAYGAFHGRVGFVDIETTGMGPWAQVTVIGVFDGIRTSTYILGDNLHEFAGHVEQLAMLVSFNGASFDLPYLRRTFPTVEWNHLHCDLRFALRRLGLSGGLKQIERRLGIAREDEIDGLSGEDAVRLWAEYCAGNEESLAQLVAYNAADVENLQTLMRYAFDRLRSGLLGEIET